MTPILFWGLKIALFLLAVAGRGVVRVAVAGNARRLAEAGA